MARNDPELAEKVCLALVCEGSTHGWAISALLGVDGALGRIWSLSRPLTYRALDQLTADGLIERVGTAPGGGRSRTLLAATEQGRVATREWLDAPVALPRDVRTELLLKFALRTRCGLLRAPLAKRQRKLFAPLLEVAASSQDDDFVAIWKREHLLAVDRFLAEIETSRT